ncbi:MAG: hypothetical protein GX802_01510 [Clostridiales bacterium]|nr:hypothetical protein [Clostridiales bacterium]
MDFRIIYIPPFKAVSSGIDCEFDFSKNGVLGKFNVYFSKLLPSNRDSFMPRDFLFYDEEKQGLVWCYAVCEGMDDGGYESVDFDGGYYLTYTYRDGDDETREKLYNEALEYIKNSKVFELDIRKNHYPMGHIITPKEIMNAQGWAQMEAFIPIKLK